MQDAFFQPVSGFDLPRFAGVPTFMRLPHVGFDHPRFGVNRDVRPRGALRQCAWLASERGVSHPPHPPWDIWGRESREGGRQRRSMKRWMPAAVSGRRTLSTMIAPARA